MVCKERSDGRGNADNRDDVHDRQEPRAKKTLETQVDKTFLGMLRSRKFMLAAVITIISTIALFTQYISGVHWVSITGIIISAYSTANVMQRRYGYGRLPIPQYDETDELEA